MKFSSCGLVLFANPSNQACLNNFLSKLLNRTSRLPAATTNASLYTPGWLDSLDSSIQSLVRNVDLALRSTWSQVQRDWKTANSFDIKIRISEVLKLDIKRIAKLADMRPEDVPYPALVGGLIRRYVLWKYSNSTRNSYVLILLVLVLVAFFYIVLLFKDRRYFNMLWILLLTGGVAHLYTYDRWEG